MQAIIGRDIGNKGVSGVNNKFSGLSLQDKKRMKYEAKKNIYEPTQNEFEKNSRHFDQDMAQSPYINNSRGPVSGMRSMDMGYPNRNLIGEQKEDANMMYDSTPKQFHSKISPYQTPMGIFASPFEQRRQIPMAHYRTNSENITFNKQNSSPNPIKGNDNKSNNEPAKLMNNDFLSPVMPSTINKLNSSLNSPIGMNTRSTVLDLLKACERGNKTDQLKAVKKLLTDFRGYQDSNKDKVFNVIDNMLAQENSSSNIIKVS